MSELASVDAASVDDLARVHSREYIERIRQESELGGGDAGDGWSPFGPEGFDCASLAAGAAIEAVRSVVDGTADSAYALVQPPGHHALRDQGMGLCLFGNAAVATAYARSVLGITRVAIVDWDVHHGNGTEEVFYSDPSVLTISVHQDGLYPPATGRSAQTGDGPGTGFNVNIPLPPGSGRGAYLYALASIVVPALRAFQPELLVLSSGYDACAMDPLGRQILHSDVYREMTEMMVDEARAISCLGPVAVHEGAYSDLLVPFCVLAVTEALAETRSSVVDPFLRRFVDIPGQELQPAQRRAVEQAKIGLRALQASLKAMQPRN